MPQREVPLIPGEIYHVFNKTMDHRQIFSSIEYCKHFLELVMYYRSQKAYVSYSKLENLNIAVRQEILESIVAPKYFRINILSYCLMPTHFHFLLYERKQKGIETFIGDTINALTRYYNLRNKRTGAIFHTRFKAVRVKNHEQLLHVSRYISLNPYSGGIVNSLKELSNYRWSSYYEFSNRKKGVCERSMALKYLKSTAKSYLKFVQGNAEYQKSLEYIKHTTKW